MTAREIDLGYRPRPQFAPYHARTQRWACIVAHRRAGKTVACVMDLIDAALRNQTGSGRYAYVAPLYTQAKDIAWTYLKQYGLAVPGAEANESELRLDFPGGSRVRLYGADNYDRLRGLYFDGVILDEYADMDPRVWPQVIRPALSDRQGWATFIGTPKGHNDFWRIWNGDSEGVWPGAEKSDDWYSLMLRASETKLIPDHELKDARRQLGPDGYAQEYECSFTAAIKGAIFAEEMQRVRSEGRICRVPVERHVPVWTAWDLGRDDATAIWFGQSVGQEERLIDYYEGSGVGLDHYARVLKDRSYLYGEHYLPHDVEVHELSSGVSRRQTLAGMGVVATVIQRASAEDAIHAVRRILDRVWIDEERCRRGIEALVHYRREYDEKNKVFRLNPLHDWSSHAVDALRHRAMAPNAVTRRPPLGVRGVSRSPKSWLTA